MNFAQAEIFFSALGRELPVKTVIVLTGGIAAGILAGPRTTDDIDFALVQPVSRGLEQVEKTLSHVAAKHGVILQYSADIDRWSSVTYLDWKKHTRPYKTIGSLEIRIMAPLYWSIGKIARSTAADVQDLEAVLKAQEVGWLTLVKLWARALRKSPASTALFNAKKQMQWFIRDSGPKVWGRDFDPVLALGAFEKFLRKQ